MMCSIVIADFQSLPDLEARLDDGFASLKGDYLCHFLFFNFDEGGQFFDHGYLLFGVVFAEYFEA